MTDWNAEMLVRVAKANGHWLDNTTPEQDAIALAYCNAAIKVARETTCPHCDVIAEPVPAAWLRWVVQQYHELHCPRYDDNTPGLHHNVPLRLPDDWGGDDNAA